jgi:hypothetical protein
MHPNNYLAAGPFALIAIMLVGQVWILLRRIQSKVSQWRKAETLSGAVALWPKVHRLKKLVYLADFTLALCYFATAHLILGPDLDKVTTAAGIAFYVPTLALLAVPIVLTFKAASQVRGVERVARLRFLR